MLYVCVLPVGLQSNKVLSDSFDFGCFQLMYSPVKLRLGSARNFCFRTFFLWGLVIKRARSSRGVGWNGAFSALRNIFEHNLKQAFGQNFEWSSLRVADRAQSTYVCLKYHIPCIVQHRHLADMYEINTNSQETLQ